MLADVRMLRSASFYSVATALSDAAVTRLFQRLRAGRQAVSQNHLAHKRVSRNGVRYSALSFSYQSTPSFLLSGSGVQETLCGFILLVEYKNCLAVFRSRLDLPTEFVSRHLRKVNSQRIEAVIAREGAVFQRMKLQNMSVAANAARSKSFEALDLASVIPIAGSNRYVPRNYGAQVDDDYMSVNPGTGRIAVRAERAPLNGFIDFAKKVIDDVTGSRQPDLTLIGRFARPVDFDVVGVDIQPTAFWPNVSALSESLDANEIRLVRHVGTDAVELTSAEISSVVMALDQTFQLVSDDGGFDIFLSGEAESVGRLTLRKSGFTWRGLELDELEEVRVERRSFPVGQDEEATTIVRYMNSKDMYLVMFGDYRYVYMQGELFVDGQIGSGAEAFLRRIVAQPALSRVVTEKGDFRARQMEFDSDSVFRVIVDQCASGYSVLICDDLGAEWADFIAIDVDSLPPRVAFFHAKHGEDSLGASQFHVAVSQAIKNLPFVALADLAIENKKELWNRNYIGQGAETNIPRTLRGAEQLDSAVERSVLAVDTVRYVYIVTSSLSRAQVAAALASIRSGEAPSPHVVQMYWLLSSFFSACMDMGFVGQVICRD